MTQQNIVDRAYMLADEWIHTILSTNPELLVSKLHGSISSGDGRAPTPNLDGAANLAKTLAEFRSQLANALISQHHPDYDQSDA